ncbi:hypothetical protein [Aminobacter sp. HY435]|uniref:hypothetical protein n=1 Tax=Aminobacter sp. HY435 TaxID=2970917 RepID=UPI002FCEAF7B
MTPEEIRAGKDSLRAEHAMAIRKVEVQLKAAQEKVLVQAVELSRNREALKLVNTEHADKGRTLSELEARGGSLREEVAKRDEQLKALGAKLAEAERRLDKRAQELEETGRALDEASLASSNRQIEIVSRESEMGKLSDDMAALRNQRKELDRRLSEFEADNKAVREALKTETKRAVELDKKLERLVATLSDRDDKLERREKELARLREQLKAKSDEQAVAAEAPSPAERGRFEGRLTTLVRENKRLKSEMLTQADRTDPLAGQDAVLREQMHELAAEVVALTARLEGADSPIAKALNGEGETPASAERSAIISLADRVRALQKSAPAE